MTQARRDRPAWPLFLIILLLGICFMLAAGQMAIRLVPTWSLIADVDSKINPNDQLAAWNGSAPIEPVSAAILTQPAWRALYLTPGASIFVPPIVPGIPTSTSEANNTPQPPATQVPGASVTPGQPTAANSSTPIIIIFPTRTSVPPTKVSTKVPTDAPTTTPTETSTATTTATSTMMVISTATSTSTVTITATAAMTPTVTDTAAPTLMPTVTETVEAPPSCENNININPPTPATTYTLVDGKINCLIYINNEPGRYVLGGTFTIINRTGSNRTFHYDCGGKSVSLGIGNNKQGSMSVSKDADGNMIVKIAGAGAGTVDVDVAEWNSGSCSSSAFVPQPKGIAWYLGLLAIATLLGILWIGMSSTKL